MVKLSVPVQRPTQSSGQEAPVPAYITFRPSGLTDEELDAWCKDKNDYLKLAFIPWEKRTDEEDEEVQRKSREYRDWHRYQDVKNGRIKFNPDIHNSKIFSEYGSWQEPNE